MLAATASSFFMCCVIFHMKVLLSRGVLSQVGTGCVPASDARHILKKILALGSYIILLQLSHFSRKFLSDWIGRDKRRAILCNGGFLSQASSDGMKGRGGLFTFWCQTRSDRMKGGRGMLATPIVRKTIVWRVTARRAAVGRGGMVTAFSQRILLILRSSDKRMFRGCTFEGILPGRVFLWLIGIVYRDACHGSLEWSVECLRRSGCMQGSDVCGSIALSPHPGRSYISDFMTASCIGSCSLTITFIISILVFRLFAG